MELFIEQSAEYSDTRFSGNNVLKITSHKTKDATKRLNRPVLRDYSVIYLESSINNEITLSKYGLNLDHTNLDRIITLIASAVVEIGYNEVVFEVTKSGILKTSILKGNTTIIINKSLSFSELEKDDVVFSIFHEREHVVSDVNNIYGLVQGLSSIRTF